MTTTFTSAPAPDTSILADLQKRYANVRTPVLMALHLLQQNSDIALDDAKAEAAKYGIRITAASVAAAKRLVEREQVLADEPVQPEAAAPARPARRPRTAEPVADTEALIRGVVSKLQAQGNAEVDRLRTTIRRVVELLNSALA